MKVTQIGILVHPIARLKIALVLIYWKTGNWIINIFRFFLFCRQGHPQKILVFRTGSIGDGICAMPAIYHLRKNYPEAQIDLLTNAGKGRRNLVSIESFISPGIFDNIINYEELPIRQLTRLLKMSRYDLVIYFSQYEAPLSSLLRDMIYFGFLVGIPGGWGWQFNRLFWFKQTQAKYLVHPNERERLNSILQRNGIRISDEGRYLFHVAKEDHQLVNNLLISLPLSGRPIIAMVPGAKRPQNRWPIVHFELVIRHFCDEFDIFLIGGPDDMLQIQPLLNLPNTYSFCGLLTPVQSGLLMQRCLLVLSNDTGPMHLAYAFGVPVAALFSNRDFANRWFPPGDGKNIVLRSTGVSCAICFSETCMDNICMKIITPEETISAIYNSIGWIRKGKTSEPSIL